MGASMVKWTQKMFQLTKTIFVLVRGLNVVPKRSLNWNSFDGDLCCCVEYSYVEN